MRGRPILGAISGFFFGVFLAVALQQWSVRPLDNLSVIGLPLIGIALGLLMAAWAPFGSRSGEPAGAAPPTPPAPPPSEPRTEA